MNETNDPVEGFTNRITLAKRLLCSPSMVGKLLEQQELRPTNRNPSRALYRTSDLDTIRARMFAAIREKASALNASERDCLRATFAAALALQGGREEPSEGEWRKGGEMADKQVQSSAAAAERERILAEVKAVFAEGQRTLEAIVAKYRAANPGK